jgi:ornithine carbamoyltransferase
MVPEDAARDLVQVVGGAYTRERPAQSRAKALQGLSRRSGGHKLTVAANLSDTEGFDPMLPHLPAAVASLRGRDLLRSTDLSPAELAGLLELAAELKRALREGRSQPLCPGRTLGMVFEKRSTRTRVSFEVGMAQLGGHALHLSGANELQMGRGESLRDTAMVLSRYLDALMVRTYAQSDIDELARFASVPVINGLTDDEHPCQALADLQTLAERFGELRGLRLAYIGDGNNTARSLVELAAMAGCDVTIATPPGYHLDRETIAWAGERAAASGGSLRETEDPDEAASGASAIYTDVFVSMGQEDDAARRLADLMPYRIDARRAALLAPGGCVLHCLPAHYGQEIDEDVLYGERSAVWDQAENRLHAQKALLAALLA